MKFKMRNPFSMRRSKTAESTAAPLSEPRGTLAETASGGPAPDPVLSKTGGGQMDIPAHSRLAESCATGPSPEQTRTLSVDPPDVPSAHEEEPPSSHHIGSASIDLEEGIDLKESVDHEEGIGHEEGVDVEGEGEGSVDLKDGEDNY